MTAAIRLDFAADNWFCFAMRYRFALLARLVFLCSCDLDLLGVDLREIAGGYRLKRTDSQFSLLTPRATGGPVIDEIGWRALNIAR